MLSMKKGNDIAPNQYQIEKSNIDQLSHSRSPISVGMKARHPKFWLDPSKD
jgi:hypothetical protein